MITCIIGQIFQALGWDDFNIKNVNPPQVQVYLEAFSMENKKRERLVGPKAKATTQPLLITKTGRWN